MRFCPECGTSKRFYQGTDFGPFCAECGIIWMQNPDRWEIRER